MSNSSGTKYLRLNELGMNRAERRKMAKDIKKNQRSEKDKTLAGMASVEDVLKVVSANRKKNNRRKK
jgi:hypothetical protein